MLRKSLRRHPDVLGQRNSPEEADLVDSTWVEAARSMVAADMVPAEDIAASLVEGHNIHLDLVEVDMAQPDSSVPVRGTLGHCGDRRVQHRGGLVVGMKVGAPLERSISGCPPLMHLLRIRSEYNSAVCNAYLTPRCIERGWQRQKKVWRSSKLSSREEERSAVSPIRVGLR